MNYQEECNEGYAGNALPNRGAPPNTTSISAVPPPTNVKVRGITAIDAVTASFVLGWSPAPAPDGKPYAKYVISSMCTCQGVPGGGSFAARRCDWKH